MSTLADVRHGTDVPEVLVRRDGRERLAARLSGAWFALCLCTRAFVIWACLFAVDVPTHVAEVAYAFVLTSHLLWRHSRHYPKPYPWRAKGAER